MFLAYKICALEFIVVNCYIHFIGVSIMIVYYKNMLVIDLKMK